MTKEEFIALCEEMEIEYQIEGEGDVVRAYVDTVIIIDGKEVPYRAYLKASHFGNKTVYIQYNGYAYNADREMVIKLLEDLKKEKK